VSESGTNLTHLAIVPRYVRIRQYLGEHRAQRCRAERRVARAGDLEPFAGEDEERGALLRRGEREEIGDLEDGDAERARVVPEDGAAGQPLDLRLRSLQESSIGGARGERMRILRIVLRKEG
jgi:hypothetical protein